MRLRKKIGSSRARLFALNSDARLPGIVIWSDRPYLENFTRGHWNRLKTTKHIKYMLTKSRACFFWGRRSAAGSSDTDTKGLGILKSMNIHANHLYWFNKWQFVISTSIFWNHQICIRTYPRQHDSAGRFHTMRFQAKPTGLTQMPNQSRNFAAEDGQSFTLGSSPWHSHIK